MYENNHYEKQQHVHVYDADQRLLDCGIFYTSNVILSRNLQWKQSLEALSRGFLF